MKVEGVALLLTLLTLESSSYGLVEPPLSLSPLGSLANFTCIPPVGSSFLRWDIMLPDVGSTLRIPNDEFDLAVLTPRGINVTFNSSFSVLHINVTSANNNTVASCVLVNLQSSAYVSLVAYDRPGVPFDLRSRPEGKGRLLLSWTGPSFPAGVRTWYVVVVSQRGGEVSRAVVNVEQYEYSNAAAGCQTYQFAVTAANGAGESQQSQLLTSSVPEVPYIQSANALSLKIQGTDRSITFHLTIQVCDVYPVQEYCVMMIQETQNLLSFKICIPANNGSDVDIVIHTADGLRPDTKYIYTITAVNVAGNSTTSPQTVYTTDVQSATITGSDHQLNATCFFAEGTLAKGCVVYLEKSGEVVYQMIPRVNGTAKGVIRTEFSVDCYNISQSHVSFSALHVTAGHSNTGHLASHYNAFIVMNETVLYTLCNTETSGQ
ncbi:hypothetical protein EMCRGX_G012041 [Ephydatia muelleri]